jgi:hypothetical protein
MMQLLLVCLLLLLPGSAWAQGVTLSAGAGVFQTCTVQEVADDECGLKLEDGTRIDIILIEDAANATTCTSGSGSFENWCQWDEGAGQYKLFTGGTGGAAVIDDLGDVNITSLLDNQILQYNQSTLKWENESSSVTNTNAATQCTDNWVLLGQDDATTCGDPILNTEMDTWNEWANRANLGNANPGGPWGTTNCQSSNWVKGDGSCGSPPGGGVSDSDNVNWSGSHIWMPGATLEPPNATTCNPDECNDAAELGRICIDNDAAPVGQQLLICQGGGGWSATRNRPMYVEDGGVSLIIDPNGVVFKEGTGIGITHNAGASPEEVTFKAASLEKITVVSDESPAGDFDGLCFNPAGKPDETDPNTAQLCLVTSVNDGGTQYELENGYCWVVGYQSTNNDTWTTADCFFDSQACNASANECNDEATQFVADAHNMMVTLAGTNHWNAVNIVWPAGYIDLDLNETPFQVTNTNINFDCRNNPSFRVYTSAGSVRTLDKTYTGPSSGSVNITGFVGLCGGNGCGESDGTDPVQSGDIFWEISDPNKRMYVMEVVSETEIIVVSPPYTGTVGGGQSGRFSTGHALRVHEDATRFTMKGQGICRFECWAYGTGGDNCSATDRDAWEPRYCSEDGVTACEDDGDCSGTCETFCIGGANDGLVCNDETDCPGGTCSIDEGDRDNPVAAVVMNASASQMHNYWINSFDHKDDVGLAVGTRATTNNVFRSFSGTITMTSGAAIGKYQRTGLIENNAADNGRGAAYGIFSNGNQIGPAGYVEWGAAAVHDGRGFGNSYDMMIEDVGALLWMPNGVDDVYFKTQNQENDGDCLNAVAVEDDCESDPRHLIDIGPDAFGTQTGKLNIEIPLIAAGGIAARFMQIEQDDAEVFIRARTKGTATSPILATTASNVSVRGFIECEGSTAQCSLETDLKYKDFTFCDDGECVNYPSDWGGDSDLYADMMLRNDSDTRGVFWNFEDYAFTTPVAAWGGLVNQLTASDNTTYALRNGFCEVTGHGNDADPDAGSAFDDFNIGPICTFAQDGGSCGSNGCGDEITDFIEDAWEMADKMLNLGVSWTGVYIDFANEAYLIEPNNPIEILDHDGGPTVRNITIAPHAPVKFYATEGSWPTWSPATATVSVTGDGDAAEVLDCDDATCNWCGGDDDCTNGDELVAVGMTGWFSASPDAIFKIRKLVDDERMEISYADAGDVAAPSGQTLVISTGHMLRWNSHMFRLGGEGLVQFTCEFASCGYQHASGTRTIPVTPILLNGAQAIVDNIRFVAWDHPHDWLIARGSFDSAGGDISAQIRRIWHWYQDVDGSGSVNDEIQDARDDGTGVWMSRGGAVFSLTGGTEVSEHIDANGGTTWVAVAGNSHSTEIDCSENYWRCLSAPYGCASCTVEMVESEQDANCGWPADPNCSTGGPAFFDIGPSVGSSTYPENLQVIVPTINFGHIDAKRDLVHVRNDGSADVYVDLQVGTVRTIGDILDVTGGGAKDVYLSGHVGCVETNPTESDCTVDTTDAKLMGFSWLDEDGNHKYYVNNVEFVGGGGGMTSWDIADNSATTGTVQQGEEVQIKIGLGLSSTYAADGSDHDVTIDFDRLIFTADGTGGGIMWEGVAGGGDGVEGILVWNPTTTDRTLTLPDESGTLCSGTTICSGYETEAHEADHKENAPDEIFVEEFGTDCGTAGQLFESDGTGGVDCTDTDLENVVLTALADDEVLMGSGATTGAYIPMPTSGTNGCSGENDVLGYNTSTNAFVCTSDGTGSGEWTDGGLELEPTDPNKDWIRVSADTNAAAIGSADGASICFSPSVAASPACDIDLDHASDTVTWSGDSDTADIVTEFTNVGEGGTVLTADIVENTVYSKPDEILLPRFVHGTTYYVDAVNGDDGNDGLSEPNAWQTLGKLDATTFYPGDHILLHGGHWFGDGTNWTLDGKGTRTRPITVGQYGNGTRPIISGALPTSGSSPLPDLKWTQSVTDPNTYYVELQAGGDPSLTDPNSVRLFYEADRSILPEGRECNGGSEDGNPCLASPDCPGGSCDVIWPLKSNDQWYYGDQDAAIDFTTIYVYDTTGPPEDVFIPQDNGGQGLIRGSAGDNYWTFENVIIEMSNGAGIYNVDGQWGWTVRNVFTRYNEGSGWTVTGHCTIDGFDIQTNSFDHETAWNNNDGANFKGCYNECPGNFTRYASGIHIERMHSHHNGGQSKQDGIKCFYTLHTKILDSYFHDNSGKGINMDGTEHDKDCIAGVGIGNSYSEIAYNRVVNNGNSGILFEYTSSHNDIHHNFVGWNGEGYGWVADIGLSYDSQYNTIRYNIITNWGDVGGVYTGYQIGWLDEPNNPRNTFVHNTVVGNCPSDSGATCQSGATTGGVGIDAAGEGNIMVNNIIADDRLYGAQWDHIDPNTQERTDGEMYDFNLYDPEPSDVLRPGGELRSLATTQSEWIHSQNSMNQKDHPFADPANDDYTPLPGSLAIGAGYTDLPEWIYKDGDFFGCPVDRAAPTIGAVEPHSTCHPKDDRQDDLELEVVYCGEDPNGSATVYFGEADKTTGEYAIGGTQCDGLEEATAGAADTPVLLLENTRTYAVLGMHCMMSADLGAGESLTFTLLDDTAELSPTVECVITGAASNPPRSCHTSVNSAYIQGDLSGTGGDDSSLHTVRVVQSGDNTNEDGWCRVVYATPNSQYSNN